MVDTEIRFGEAKMLSLDDQVLDINTKKTANVSVIAGINQPELSHLINIFLLKRASKVKDTLPISKALLKWCRWLESKDIDAFTSSIFHYKSPTYGFREELLINVHEESASLSYNTASNYINVVKSFYDFLHEYNVIDKSQFYKPVSRVRGKGNKVDSTDLSIKNVKSHSKLPLNPLLQEECIDFLTTIRGLPSREYLMLMLMLGCGLRGQEVYTMNSRLFTSERFGQNDSFLMSSLEISPKYGVETKYEIPRDLFITKALYEEVLDYVESEEYLNRLKRYRQLNPNSPSSNYDPLFIINGNRRANEETIRNLWVKVKRMYQLNFEKTLKHRPHDLRATFGANLLTVLADEIGDVKQALDIVKIALGHRELSTTIKYLNHFNRQESLTKAANILDRAADRFYSRAYTGVNYGK